MTDTVLENPDPIPFPTAPENPGGTVHGWNGFGGLSCGAALDGKQASDDADQVTCKNCQRATASR